MNYTFSQLGHQLQRSTPYLPKVAVLLLSVYLLHFAAGLTWRLLPAPNQQNAIVSTSSTSTQTSTSSQINIQPLQQLFLFGKAEQKKQPVVQEEEITNAPETNLNLTLTGVVDSDDPEEEVAIIENRGQQVMYAIGDKIEGTNVTLQKVMIDRVLIKNAGKTETLMLDGLDYAKASKRNKQQLTQSRQQSADEERRVPDAAAIREQFSEEPASFTDYISVTPHSDPKTREPIGYRVAPGRKPQLFESAGLQNNDVVTEINGLDLTDPQQAMEAMGALKTEPSLQLTVVRDGQLETLFIDLPQAGDADEEYEVSKE